jgi:formylglycine-generating enzyme required for sulfatase activity
MKFFLPLLTVFFATMIALVADDAIPPVPAEPKVPAKADLPPKDFTQTVEEGIKIPDEKDPDKFTIQKSKTTFEMVYIKGGEFQMGSPDNEAGRKENEGPVHKVTVAPFWLAKFETTWELFDLWFRSTNLPRRDEAEGIFEAKNPDKKLLPDAITRPTNPYVDETYEHGREGKPAICMSHHASMVFCHWLRGKTNLGYRLPTEAEWEFACRAGQPGPYGFEGGKDRLGDYAWFKDNSKNEDKPEGTTQKVGTKKPNAFGLFDMHGNVAEWCLDQYDAKAYETQAKDPKALNFIKPTDAKWSHVVRGGSWLDTPEKLRSATRWSSEKDWMREDPQFPRSVWWLTKMDMIGFRVALPVEEYPELVGLKPSVIKKGQ